MRLSRRDVLRGVLLGAGGLGLRALATGIPLGILSRPVHTWADPACGMAQTAASQYLVLSLSSQGDPVNANVPGTYAFPDVVHPPDPRLAPATITLAGKSYTASQAWAQLPQAVLDRTCFFHHATLTNIHPNLPMVVQLMGGTAGGEMLPSICAKALAPCLQTIQTEPVVIGAGDVLTFEGRALPSMPATALRDILAHPAGPVWNLHTLRDQTMDQINGILKSSGTAAQRALINSLALSRTQARSISDALLNTIGAINSDAADGQVMAAAALIKMNVSPVVAISIPFGADNHTDPDLVQEAAQTLSGVGYIASLMTNLANFGLQDQVTFAMLNVFGRTLVQEGLAGRNHWGDHHVTVLIGKGVQGGVIGGIEPSGGDYAAQPIDSATGAGTDSGDIPLTSSLGAVAKTIGAALGVPQATLNQNISLGKTVQAALA